MATEYLNTGERTRLSELLFDLNQTMDSVEKRFKEIFPLSRYTAVAYELQGLCKELIASSEGVALIIALTVANVMKKSDCQAAKVLLFDNLVELERAIRRDMFLLEQTKYASKEAKETKKSAEAILADSYRIHSGVKVFAFQLLSNSLQGDEKASSFVMKKQDAIDSALDTWEKSGAAVKEPLADLSFAWTAEKERRRCGALSEYGAVFDGQPNRRSAVTLQTASVRMPSMPVAAGELHYLLPGSGSQLLFDNQPPSMEWTAAKALLDAARKGTLSKSDEQTLLLSLSDRVIQRLGVNGSLLSELAEHSPDVCAAILVKLPTSVASGYIQTLLKGNLGAENVETVLLHASKVLEQINVRTYAAGRMQYFREKIPLSASDKEALKNFTLVLHQLVTKASKENKEIYIADAIKPDLEQLFQSSGAPEIISRWEEMKN